MATALDPARSVSIDTGVRLATNGLGGDAKPFVRRQLGAPSLSSEFLGALNAPGVQAQSIVEITGARDVITEP